MRIHQRILMNVLLATLLVFAMAAQAPAQNLRPKVDNFIIFVDHSGSMAMKSDIYGGVKIERAKELATRMNAKIPALGYMSSVNAFAPPETFLAPTRYSKPAVADALNMIDTKYEIYGRNTPMGDGLKALDPVLGSMSGRTAVIIFTDGDSNYGSDPVAVAQSLYAKYPNTCLHIVSYEDNDHGRQVVKQIRGLNSCSVAGDPLLLANDAALDQFVRDVFYETAPEQAMAPAEPREMPPAQAECETITLGNMNFAFDKYMITTDMLPALEQALTVMNDSSCKGFIVEGHTDYIGTVKYNQGLSERRANSVARWLVQKGYTGKLTIVGKGELSPKYDNKTKEGRYLNRRVEIHNDSQ